MSKKKPMKFSEKEFIRRFESGQLVKQNRMKAPPE
jgi:hypothetical protein